MQTSHEGNQTLAIVSLGVIGLTLAGGSLYLGSTGHDAALAAVTGALGTAIGALAGYIVPQLRAPQRASDANSVQVPVGESAQITVETPKDEVPPTT